MIGLFDLENHEKRIKSYQTPLSKLNKLIEWEIFRKIIEDALHIDSKGAGGRPSYDKVMMFKILILQKYYNLGDRQTEFQINDRTSFKQFLDLKLGDKVPDEKTIWHFKEQLSNKNLSQELFNLFTNQLLNQGIIAKEGSMVDASFIDVPKQRNSKDENADIKKGAVPLDFAKKDKNGKRSKLSQKDCDAKWTKKGDEKYYGYKDHINADEKTKLITKYSVSSASSHDSTEIENIIDATDNKLHADSAYRSEKIEKFLKDKNCISFVHEKGYKNNPLSITKKKSNSIKSKTRARVEHIFGFMTNSMNNALHMKSIGIKRITESIGLLNLVYNLFRYEQLVRLYKVKKM